jgi:heme exporter protein B
MRRILLLIQQEFFLEWRQKNSLFGIAMYLVSLVFLIYNLQQEPEALVWNSMIWLCVLFICINSVAKSFMSYGKGRWLYYYSIFSPQEVMISKLIYSTIYMLVVGGLNIVLFNFFIGFPAIRPAMFVGLFLLGSVSFGLLFTFLSAIVSKVNNNTTLLAILGFPLVLPMLLLLGDLSTSAFVPLMVKGWNSFFAAFIGMDILIVGLSIILYPFLWKEN